MLSIALTRQPSYNHLMSNPLAARCAFSDLASMTNATRESVKRSASFAAKN